MRGTRNKTKYCVRYFLLFRDCCVVLLLAYYIIKKNTSKFLRIFQIVVFFVQNILIGELLMLPFLLVKAYLKFAIKIYHMENAKCQLF